LILPNQLTILRIILTPIFLYFFLFEGPWYKEISLAIFFIAALTDWYDGWLARKFNYFTDWGRFWDPMADKILTSAAYFGFVYLGVLDIIPVLLIVFRDFAVTIFRNYADKKGMTFATSKFAKWKTAIQLIFLYYLLIIVTLKSNSGFIENYSQFVDTIYSTNIVSIVFWIIALVTTHSGIDYFVRNRKIIFSSNKKKQ